MTFLEIVGQAREHVRSSGRVSLKALRREFSLDEESLDDLVEELVDVQQVATREGNVLVWAGDGSVPTALRIEPTPSEPDHRTYTPKHLVDKILSSRSAVEGERKQVTVLFADVKGSMELAEQVDAEQWHKILDGFFEILADGVHRFEGTVNQYTGDGIMALFGAPIAHEDHAQRACYAALDLRTQLRAYADDVRRTHGVSFSTRMGINSGEVIVGSIGDDLRMDYTAQGHTVGLAQRMESLAEPGAVFLTAHTASLAEGYFALRSLGSFELKGASEPLEVFELEGIGSVRTRLDRSRSRGFSRFVGREREMQALEGALENALEGNGQVVGVVANAGVGKSRLCVEFLERCRTKGISVYDAHCPAHGKTVHLLPIFEMLRSFFGMVEGEPEQIVREKIAGRLLLLDRDFDDVLPLVWEFLSVADPARPAPDLGPAARQSQLYDFVRRLVQARSATEPTVLLIDDLHWIDAGSDGFVAQLVDVAQSARILVVLNFRPEYRAEWMQRSYYQQLPLATLGDDDIRQLAGDLLGTGSSVAELPDTVVARAGGNPFFAEEIVQSLAESGHLEGERGSYLLARPIDSIAVPDTVQAILSARIDRLAERVKGVLQTAAIVGREFPQGILREVVALPEGELYTALSALAASEFLYEQALYPEPEYAFKHPLTHEVAYRSQLAERRKSLHSQVARAIHARDPERANEKAALLAYHWDAAEQPQAAVEWHRRAAESIGLLEVVEAMRHWQRVRELLEALPDSQERAAQAFEARVQLLLFDSRGASTLDEDAARALFEEACDFGARSGDPSALARALLTYAYNQVYRGRLREGAALGERAVAEADKVGDRSLQVAARWTPVIDNYFRGELERSIELCSEAIELSGGESSLGTEILSISPYYFMRGIRGAANAYLGRHVEARADAEYFREENAPSDRYSFFMSRLFRVVLDWLTGENRAGLANARHAIEQLRDHAVPVAQTFQLHMVGMALVFVEEWDEAREAFSQSLATAREHNSFLQQEAETLTWLGRVDAERGELGRARAELAEAERVAERIHTRLPLPLLHYTRARIAWHERGADARSEIEDELKAALDLSRDIKARLFEPFCYLELGAIAGACGDEGLRREHLEEARRLFLDMGAERNAGRVARQLAG